MKSTLFFFLIILMHGVSGFSQENVVGGDLFIKFDSNDGKEKMIRKESDFCYSIVQSNLSTGIKKVYKLLVWDDSISRFANYYLELYKKSSSGFVFVAPPSINKEVGFHASDLHIQYGDKGDSIFAVYDIEKKDLLPSGTDTLCFNLLYDNQSLEPGQYRFRVHFRIGNAYSIKKNKREISDMFYITSDWYYFQLPKKMTGYKKPGQDNPCDCVK